MRINNRTHGAAAKSISVRAGKGGEDSTKMRSRSHHNPDFKRPQGLDPYLLYSTWFFIGYWILHEAGFLSGLFLFKGIALIFLDYADGITDFKD